MNIDRMIANKGLRTWDGGRRKGRGHRDGRTPVCGKGGKRLYRAAKRGSRAKSARIERADAA